MQPEILKAEFHDAYTLGNWPEAIDVALRWHGADPAAPLPAYNLACCYSRLGNTELALRWLQESIRRGYDDPEYLAADRDFERIRGESAFHAALASARANHRPPNC